MRSNQYVANNQLIEDRLQLMEGNVGQVFDILTEFKTLLINALNEGNAAELGLQNHASEMMTQVSTLLNADLDGRHLFAGSMTNTPPVDLTGLPVNVANIRTQIGNTRSSLAEIEKTHQDFILFANETIGDLENTDITLAITKLNETQVTLEASYMTLSRLGQISLLQFLR